MKRLFTTLLLFLAFPAIASGAGGVGSVFGLGMGARSAGIGGGGSAYLTDQSGIYFNPALLAISEFQTGSLAHTQLFQSSIFNTAAYTVPIGFDQGIGFGYMRIGSSGIDRFEQFASVGEFDYSQTQFMISYGRRISSPLSVGVTIKMSEQRLDQLSDFGFSFDLAAVLQVNRYLNLSMAGRDILPPEYKLDETAEKLSRSIAGGIAVHGLALSPGMRLALIGEIEKTERTESIYRAGTELSITEGLQLRAGYAIDHPTLGIGLQLDNVSFDYGIGLLETIDDQHTVSLTVRLGTSRTERRQLAELERMKASGEFDRQQRFEANRQKGKEYFDSFQLDSALVYYQRALAFDETNQELIGTIAAIEKSRAIQQEQETLLREMQAEERQTIRTSYDQASQLYNRGYYRPALDLLSLIFEIQPDNSQAIELKGEIERAIQADITRSMARGDSALSSGQPYLAVESYNRVLGYEPEHEAALDGKRRATTGLDLARQLNLAIEAYNGGKLEDARRLFRQVLQINPQEQLARNYLQRMDNLPELPKSSNFEDLQQDPVYWPLYLEGLRHMRNKAYQQAIDVWTRVLQAYPENKNTSDNISQARLRLQGAGDPK